MRRLITLFTALAVLVPLVHAQQTQNLTAQTNNRGADKVGRLATRPPSEVVVPPSNRLYITEKQDPVASSDSLAPSEILNRISRIYDYQARILKATAVENYPLVEELLDLSMSELQDLMVFPEVVERRRFRELYRTVITEYERYYGVAADTLVLPFGDIFAFQAEMFAALNDMSDPLLEDVMMPELPPAETVIPMTMNRLVQQSINYLLRSPEKHLYLWLSRSQTYFPMIERVLAEEGLPDELKYLAMIESGLNPRARSWAQANGMWQFIAATGRAYGLQVNSWVDERLDPEKSTRAAARHLRDLYDMFGGDWQLALAGYNCSPSRIKRAISRAERRLGRRATFWDIYNDIPRETRNYVPMFIAASLVASNPDAFGIDVDNVAAGPRYAYHYVPVRGFLSIDQIADLAETDATTIRALNPELRRANVPPTADGYYVRIPLGSYEQFAIGYEKLPPDVRRTTIEHVVRSGDTLGKLARQYGVEVRSIMQTNGLRSTVIRVGQRIVVPVPTYDSSPLLASLDGEKVLTVEYGRSNVRPITVSDPIRSRPESVQRSSTPVIRASDTSTDRPSVVESRPEEPSETGKTRVVYTVQRGDNLTDIAQKYDVSVSDIRSWNSISGSKIHVGQKLYLYGDNPTPSTSDNRPTEYRVRRGDTLGAIAKRYGVSVSELRQWNNLTTTKIRVGQRLVVSQKGEEAPLTYRVRRGDSLSTIAKKHGVSVNDLRRWNNLKTSTIRPGQTLKVSS